MTVRASDHTKSAAFASPSGRGTLGWSVASLALGFIYYLAPNDLIPDSQPWGLADDAVVMAVSVIVSWLVLPAATRIRLKSQIPIEIGARQGAVRGRPEWSTLSTDSHPATSKLQTQDKLVSLHGTDSRDVEFARNHMTGTIYGRIFLDVCQSRQGKWAFYRTETFAGYVRQFLTPNLVVAYSFAKNGLSKDMETDVAAAVQEIGAGSHPRIMKLYAMLPNDCLHYSRNRILEIAGRKYFVLSTVRSLRDRIHIGQSYETFLTQIGGHSRRNMRHVRRRAIQSGITHSITLARNRMDEPMRGLAGHNHPAGFRPRTVAAIHGLLAEHGQGFHSILRFPSGDLLSCCSGFIEGDTAFIIHQMNHHDHLEHNPSLTNRSFLIEYLIERGVTDLVFSRGCRGILHHVCRQESGATLWVIQRSAGSVLCAMMLLCQFQLTDIPQKLRAFFAHLARGPAGNNGGW